MFYAVLRRMVNNSHDSIQELYSNAENDRDSKYVGQQDFKR